MGSCWVRSGGEGEARWAVLRHVAISFTQTTDDLRAFTSRVPQFVALAADRLLIVVNYTAPFVGDFE